MHYSIPNTSDCITLYPALHIQYVLVYTNSLHFNPGIRILCCILLTKWRSEPFQCYVGVLLVSCLGSFLDHVGVILESFWGPFWGHLGGDPPPLPPPQRRGSILGPPFAPFWGHFWDPFGTPWETLGDPKGPTGRPKALPRGVSRGVQNQTPKRTPFWTPPGGAQVSSRLSESTVFTILRGSLLGPHFGTILGPLWDPRGPLYSPRGVQGGKRGR